MTADHDSSVRPRAGETVFDAEQAEPAPALDLRANSRKLDADVTARFSEGPF
jgi:hypothetical protein